MIREELRIGNTVFDNGKEYDVRCGEDLDWLSFDPIPLTEEWLLKFSFKIKSHYAVGVGSYYTYDFGKLSLLKNLKGEFYFPALPFSTVIHSVHQLQNLYFALTGEELILKSND